MSVEYEKKWIVLSKKEEGKGFVQTGPFSDYDVKQKISSGEILYTDHIWKEGFLKWTKISEVKEFEYRSPVQGHEIKEPEGPQQTDEVNNEFEPVESSDEDLEEEATLVLSEEIQSESEEILKNESQKGESSIDVVEVKDLKKAMEEIEDRPPEAEGENLAEGQLNKSYSSTLKSVDEELEQKRKGILSEKKDLHKVIPFPSTRKTQSEESLGDKTDELPQLDGPKPKKKQVQLEDRRASVEDKLVTPSIKPQKGPPPKKVKPLIKTAPSRFKKETEGETMPEIPVPSPSRRVGDRIKIRTPKVVYLVFGIMAFGFSMMIFYVYDEVRTRLGQKKRLEVVKQEKKSKGQNSAANLKLNHGKKAVVKKEVKSAPTYMNWKAKYRPGGLVDIDIQTDGSSHFPIEVKVQANPGRFVGGIRFNQSFKQFSLAKEWNRKTLSVPPGYFSIELNSGTLKKTGHFIAGEREVLNKKLRKFKKQLSYTHIQERYMAFEALDLFSQAFDAIRKKNLTRKLREQVLAFNPGKYFSSLSEDSEFVFYPKDWREIKSHHGDLVEAIQKGQVSASLKTKINRTRSRILSKNLW